MSSASLATAALAEQKEQTHLLSKIANKAVEVSVSAVSPGS
jgi:hypothetical protein